MSAKHTFFKTIWIFTILTAQAQSTWSQRMAETAMYLWPAGQPRNWNYEQGVVMTAIQKVYEETGHTPYLQYIQRKVDYFVSNTGRISTYNLAEYNLDHIASGRALLFLHQQTSMSKYKLAAEHLRSQLLTHPRTASQGFWHKNIYPNQMWLDGLYMAEPFYAEYSAL
ncbi:MAG TPA: glycoside hydrolase family 88 protein, partial [Cytophagales bacterium]|nr:glycoside hydrolase family 88 protein [Cytophagales bacterium]